MMNHQRIMYGYARASGALQETSVENQCQALERYFKEHLAGEWKWGGMFCDDGVSAFSIPFDERPQGRRLWTALRPGDGMLFTRHDRLIRSMKDGGRVFEMLRSKNVTAISISDGVINTKGAGGSISFSFWSLIGQATSELISDRTKEGKQELMVRGERSSQYAPAGYKFLHTGQFRRNGKPRVLVVPAYGDRHIYKRRLLEYLKGDSLEKVTARHWTELRKKEIQMENNYCSFVGYMPYAFHCYVLGWPSTFFRGQYRRYMREATQLGFFPERPHRERIMASLEFCQDLMVKGIDLSTQKPGHPHILPVISGLKLADGSPQFPTNV